MIPEYDMSLDANSSSNITSCGTSHEASYDVDIKFLPIPLPTTLVA
jgi:hypothetical protein